jgi:uncharacterized membrane protein
MNVIIVALFIAFLWGAAPVIHKNILKTVDRTTIIVIGSFFYTICIIGFAIYNWDIIKKDVSKIKTNEVFLIAFAAITTGFLASVLYFYILNSNDSYVVSALIHSSPIFTLILAFLYLREKITFIGGLGVLLIFIGVVCLAVNDHKQRIK